MPRLTIEGLDDLRDALKENVTMQDMQRVIRHNGAGLQQKMQAHADFTKGYQTGATKGRIYLEIIDDGMTAVVEPTTHYSPYLEYGTRKMEAQPFVKPAFDEQVVEFKSDLDRLVK